MMSRLSYTLFILALLISFGSIVQAIGYYPGWSYQSSISINSNEDINQYRLRMVLDGNSLLDSAHFFANTQNDFDDIRFSNEDQNAPIEYWIESSVDDVNVVVWVRSHLRNGPNQLYLYYGNGSATSNSSIRQTFGADWKYDTTSGWTEVDPNGVLSISGGRVNLDNVQKVFDYRLFTDNNVGFWNKWTIDYNWTITAAAASSENRSIIGFDKNYGIGETISNAKKVNNFMYDGAPGKVFIFGNAATTSSALNVGQSYYARAKCNGSVFDFNYYSNPERTTLVQALSDTCGLADANIFYPVNGVMQPGTATASAKIDDTYFNFLPATQPTFLVSACSDCNLATRIVDEETGNGISGATVTIQGQSFTTDGIGNVDFNSSTISFPMTMSVSKTGYSTRDFYFITPAGLNQSPLLGLRDEDETRVIVFKFFAPDEVTALPTRVIEVKRNQILSGRQLTDTSGFTTFTLAPQDSVYDFDIYLPGLDSNVSNIQYSYDAVTVTVNAPRNEANDSVISSPSGFNLDVGGLGLQNITGQSSFPFSTIFILGNTQNAYTLRVVDTNATAQQYFARNYVLHALGDITSITITPYLIDIDDGILVNAKVIDAASNITISNLRFTLISGISNAVVVVEDVITDITGIAQLVMLSQKQYSFDITTPNQDTNYLSGTVAPVSEAISFYINYFSVDSNFTPKNIVFQLTPKTDSLSGISQQIDFNIGADFPYQGILVQAFDGNVVEETTSSSSNPFNSNIVLTLSDYNSGQAIVRFTVIGLDTNTIITKTYLVNFTGGGGILNLGGLGNSLNSQNFLLISVLGMIGLVVFMGQGALGNNDSQVFVGAIGLSIMVYLFFRGYFIYMIGTLLAAGAAWLWVRSNR